MPQTDRPLSTGHIEEALRLNVLRRQLGPISWAHAFERLAEARGIGARLGSAGRPPVNADTVSALSRELGVNPRTARRRLRLAAALRDHPELASRVDRGELDARGAERMMRQEHYAELRATTEPTDIATGEQWELRQGDFADVLDDIEPGSVDMVLCDPPYNYDFAERWRDLSAVSARLLRPGGVAAFYVGHQNLPSIIAQLSECLSWLWHAVLIQPGLESRMNQPQVHNGHRDVLLLTNGTYRPKRWLRDTLTAKTQPDKSLHPWQQRTELPAYLVDLLSQPGGLVLDPCVGAGTFGAVAISCGRRFLGVDIDPVTLGVARDRLTALAEAEGA